MKDDRLYLIHLRETLARIKKHTAGGKAEFLSSELVQDATIRNLQILTESTQRLSDQFKQQHPAIDWAGMAGFRNVLVHGYLSIDLPRVWKSSSTICQLWNKTSRRFLPPFQLLPNPSRND